MFNERAKGIYQPKDIGLTWAYLKRTNPETQRVIEQVNKRGRQRINVTGVISSVATGVALGVILSPIAYEYLIPLAQTAWNYITTSDNEHLRQIGMMYQPKD